MKLQTPIVALLLASVFFLGIFGFFTQIGQTYEEQGFITEGGIDFRIDNNTKQFNEAFDQIDTTKDDIDNISESFSSLKPTFLSVWPAINLVFRTGKLIITGVRTTETVGSATGQILGIDPMITDVLFMILLIVILIAVLLVLSGRTQ